MSELPIPAAALSQHIAIVGKTGSGKTSTAKLLVEQVVADGARVCVLDPIKSDWWGVISSADGKKPGLPFHILGGPRGHVPLHSGAGAAIAELVAKGELPLSVLDMADFEPGGQNRFFVAFADTLLKRMRGALYLVLEEAHEFAPKERAGFDKENLSIHFAKKLATAGRSKGIRLVVVTQRTQSLHNAMLGSCDTIVAHRLTAPADQDPIIKWLKANAQKNVLDEVSASLSSLKTGTAWLCSGEARLFERTAFQRIHTFDNSATPTSDAGEIRVSSAAVDFDKLRALIGTAVADAEANDPKKLKARIAELEKELARAPTRAERLQDIEASTELLQRIADVERQNGQLIKDNLALERHRDAVVTALDRAKIVAADMVNACEEFARELSGKLQHVPATPPFPTITKPSAPAPVARPQSGAHLQRPAATSAPRPHTNGSKFDLTKPERKVLTVLAQHGPCNAGRLALLSGYSYGGTFRNVLASLRSSGLIEGANTATMSITDAGLNEGPFEALPTGEALRQHWLNFSQFGTGERKVLQALLDHPEGLDAQQLTEATGYQYGGTFRNLLAALRTAGVVVGKNTGVMRASEELFG